MITAAIIALTLADPITAVLTPADPTTKESIRWSPKGAAIPLKQDGTLFGTFSLGHKDTPRISIRLGNASNHYDTLWVDINRNGSPNEGEVFTTTPTERTGKWWSSFGPVNIPIPTADGKSRPYPINLWYVEDPLEPEAVPTLRWSRRGWHEGQITLGDKPAFVLITEMNMDGVFDQRDHWIISRTRAGLWEPKSRGLEDHVWLDGICYRPLGIDPDGMYIKFESFDPGFTEAEEANKRDPYLEDKAAARAPKPVPFGHDFEAAVKQSQKENKKLLIDFEATWCGPCKTMDELVYTAQAVVDAAKNIIPVKVDGDIHRDLTKKYNVTAYPTMILLDSKGKELNRAVGYRGVKDMVKFLAP